MSRSTGPGVAALGEAVAMISSATGPRRAPAGHREPTSGRTRGSSGPARRPPRRRRAGRCSRDPRRPGAGERVEVLDGRIGAHRAEDPPGHRVEEGLRQLGVGPSLQALSGGTSSRPRGSAPGRRLPECRARRRPPVEMDAVEREPGRRVGLGAAPVAPLEPLVGPAGDLLEAADPCLVRGMNRGGGAGDRLPDPRPGWCSSVDPVRSQRRSLPRSG